MRGDQEDKYKKNNKNEQNGSDLSIRRQQSFINSMKIYAPDMFEKGTQQISSAVPHQVSNHFSKQQHDNVFTGFLPDDSQKYHQTKLSKTHNYQRQCLQYQKYLFDNRIKLMIKRMAIKAYSIFKNQKQGPFFIFPIQRLLVAIAKKMLLNRFQLLFLQYVFQQTKWHYGIQCIRKHVSAFKSYIMIPDSEILNENLKMVEIYILYCSYFSKKSLNQLTNDNIFIHFAQKICPKFLQLFSQWTQNIFGKINTKQLNSIFKKLNSNLIYDHQQIQNYCLLVQQIIDISPAYNADKSNKKQKPRKKNKQIINSKEEQDQQDGMVNQGRSDSNHLPSIVQQDDELHYPQLNKKKQSVLSVDLLEAQHYLNRKPSHQSQSDRKQ